MKKIVAAAALLSAFATVGAAGDAAKGAKDFRKCKSCHMIVADDGTTIVKGGRTGPNLYGIIGRQAGTVDGYRYGASLVDAGNAGLVWDEATFVEYVQDPKGFLATTLDDSKARSKMSFRLRKGMDDVYAYLVSVGPQN
ncbi:MAG: c-type cytochrome [Paracoccaceae bacterium]